MRQRVGGARTSPIEHDQPGERRQRAKEQGEPGLLPGDVDVAEAEEGHDQVGRPVANHLVGDPVSSQPRILRLGQHRSPQRGRRVDEPQGAMDLPPRGRPRLARPRPCSSCQTRVPPTPASWVIGTACLARRGPASGSREVGESPTTLLMAASNHAPGS